MYIYVCVYIYLNKTSHVYFENISPLLLYYVYKYVAFSLIKHSGEKIRGGR